MYRFDQVFKQKLFQIIPYLSVGLLSDLDLSKLIGKLVGHSVQAIEFGFPFSDAVADGPIIQAAAKKALENGFTIDQGFQTLSTIRAQYPKLGISLMLYANQVYAYGLDNFYRCAQQAGVDGVLIADCPNIEIQPFLTKSQQYGIQPILFATPNCQDEELQFLSEINQAYIYLISRAGVTGIDKRAQFEQLQPVISKLKTLCKTPIVCGFGIKDSNDLENAQAIHCQGAIIGSKILNYFIQPQQTFHESLAELDLYLTQLIQSMETVEAPLVT